MKVTLGTDMKGRRRPGSRTRLQSLCVRRKWIRLGPPVCLRSRYGRASRLRDGCGVTY